MMPTDKQRSASRRNGRLSSGPKTETGKKTSSLNALRHGLSAQTSLLALNPNLDKIQEQIQGEVGDPSFARQIAGRIIDYERTESYLLQVAQKEAVGADGFVDQAGLDQSREAVVTNSDRLIHFEQEKQRPGLSKSEKAEVKVLLDVVKFLGRFHAQREQKIIRDVKRDAVGLRRYYKRASNQLIKAIKAVANA